LPNLNHDPPVLYLLSSRAYRYETWALNLYAILDCHEVLKGIFSEGAVIRKKTQAGNNIVKHSAIL
jgi:hypothetical protein